MKIFNILLTCLIGLAKLFALLWKGLLGSVGVFYRWLEATLSRLAHSPLFIAVLPVLLGYGVFLLQTQVEKANQLQQARFAALQEVASFYGAMVGNLDALENARCEIMMGRLTEQGIIERSREMRSKLNETQMQAESLKYKIAVLFSPSARWYKLLLRWISTFNPSFGYRPQVLKRDNDNMLSSFQDFHQHYLEYEKIALHRAKVVPQGISCEMDDRTYLDGFHARMPFKLIRIYNQMAGPLGVSTLELDVRKRANWEASQSFHIMMGGRLVIVDCKSNPDGTQKCLIVGERPKTVIP